MISDYEAFAKEIHSKLGGMTLDKYVAAHPGEHLFVTYDGITSCAFCGVVKQHDDPRIKKTCRGLLAISLRCCGELLP